MLKGGSSVIAWERPLSALGPSTLTPKVFGLGLMAEGPPNPGTVNPSGKGLFRTICSPSKHKALKIWALGASGFWVSGLGLGTRGFGLKGVQALRRRKHYVGFKAVLDPGVT